MRDDHWGQEVVTTRRRRQIKLIGEVLFNLLAIGFGALGVVVLIHHIITPELRNVPFDSTLDPLIGHLPSLIFYLGFCLIVVVSCLFFLRKSIHLLRDDAYLEAEYIPPYYDP
ncbi:MAG: hypothetical protein ABI700_08700 [Chloroflexota bacterium]